MSQGKESSGGRVNYYLARIESPQREEQPPYIAECEDIIDVLGMTFDEANIFKEIWRTANERTHGKGKVGNTPLRAAQKLVHYAGRILRKAQRAQSMPDDAIIPLMAQPASSLTEQITREVILNGHRWTHWGGTTDGKPTVSDNLKVEVQLQSGECRIDRADKFDWKVRGHLTDICKYRAAQD
ncbi:hypothetical protein [Caballeronia sp. LZ034LL]|uniref:hypothetical protein n=1 Tax=Caballeronia sp. LZ034LL TaxID=3038567 RepID=UPI00285A954B|nr:hypothetical protein [Caballeronia sp. LZ034LL]MDR5839305.1 hypothetical protein [Caballeronia sp. LZ034LL]